MSKFDVNGYNSHECDIHNHGYYLGAQSQQDKIDELKKKYDAMYNAFIVADDCRKDWHESYISASKDRDELQAMVDKALERMDAESSNSWGLWKEKADMYEQGASDAYEKSYWILKGNKDEN